MRKILAVMLALMLCGCGRGFDAGGEITLISREDGSGTRRAFTEIFGLFDGRRDFTSKDSLIANKTDILLANVAGNPQAVGYTSASAAGGVKMLAVDGVYPTAENITGGSYKAVRRFSAVYKNDVSAAARDFIRFALSRGGQEIAALRYAPSASAPDEYTPADARGKITVSGSSSVSPLAERLREAYLLYNPDVKIEIQLSDSTSGITDVLNGICDIGLSSRSLTESESAALKSDVIALDGIAVIVNPHNPISEISSAEVRAVFGGEITEWRGLCE